MTTKHQDDQSGGLLKPPPRRSFLQRRRNDFLTGIVVVAPFAITVYLTWTIINYVDRQVLPQVLPLIPDAYRPDKLLPFSLPGLGLVVFVLFLIFVGSFTKNFFGRELLRIGERWVDRMPVVRSIYNALKQIAETIFTQSNKTFEHACLVEYPRKGLWAVAFVSTATQGEVPRKAVDGRKMMSVFLPTTPNPTSGFLLFVPEEDVILLDMSIEDAAKLVISAGLVTPQANGGSRSQRGDAPTAPAAGDLAPGVAAEVARRPYSARLQRERAEAGGPLLADPAGRDALSGQT